MARMTASGAAAVSRPRAQLAGTDMADALRYHASGLDAHFAAVNLLIDHITDAILLANCSRPYSWPTKGRS